MRTVAGRTDRIVIVGAGLGGLATALHLARSGRSVTVLERADVPGGRAGLIVDGGYRFDNGPTVLTMPDLLAETFAAVDEDLNDWLTLKPLDPLYRAWYPDGSVLNVLADKDAMAEEIRSICGPSEEAGFLRFVDFVTRLYRYEMHDFIDRNIDSPLDLVRPNLARLVAAGGFRRMSSKVSKYLKDPRTQRIFSFQAMYAGLSPFDALALYCVITYMDSVAGVYLPEGGMHAVPEAMAQAAQKHGVTIRYDTEVKAVEHSGGRAHHVVTTDGERITCDAVVLNADLPTAKEQLLGIPASDRRLKYSPSCFLLLAGSRLSYSQIAHHNIHFGRAWRSVFDQLIDRGELMTDPSFLVSCPTITEPTLAPEGKHSYYVFFPTPNTTANLSWEQLRPFYRDHVLQMLDERGYREFASGIETEHIIDPRDWEQSGMTAGTPFAASHTFTQTGPFRPKNLWGENVVFAGSGTTPGVGVPMVLISGRLAAQRITGLSQ